MKYIKSLLIFLLVFALSGCGKSLVSDVSEKTSIEKAFSERNESSEIGDTLFSYCNTSVSDRLAIQKIIKKIPCFDSKNVSVECSGNIIMATYGIERLTKYRSKNLLKKKLTQVSTLLFSMVPKCNEVHIAVKDAYNNIYEYSIRKNDVKDVYGFRQFDSDRISKAQNSKKDYENFLLELLDVKYDESDITPKMNEINKIIGEFCEAESKPHYSGAIKYEKGKSIPGIPLENIKNIEIYDGRSLSLEIYSVRNFEQKKVLSYLFVFNKSNIVSYRIIENIDIEKEIIRKIEGF